MGKFVKAEIVEPILQVIRKEHDIRPVELVKQLRSQGFDSSDVQTAIAHMLHEGTILMTDDRGLREEIPSATPAA